MRTHITVASVALLALVANAQAALLARNLDADPTTTEAYYDTALQITWLADANKAAGSAFDDGASAIDGRMTWQGANAWAGSLVLGGTSAWRLPKVAPVGGGNQFQYTWANNGSTDVGYAATGPGGGWGVTSELGFMFYVTLANLGYYVPLGSGSSSSLEVQSGWGLLNKGPFANLEAYNYWTETKDPVFNAPDYYWFFQNDEGFQNIGPQDYVFHAWAVHDGDVGSPVTISVPEPGTLALALLALSAGALGRRQRQY